MERGAIVGTGTISATMTDWRHSQRRLLRIVLVLGLLTLPCNKETSLRLVYGH